MHRFSYQEAATSLAYWQADRQRAVRRRDAEARKIAGAAGGLPVPSQRMEVYPRAKRSRSSGARRGLSRATRFCASSCAIAALTPIWSATRPRLPDIGWNPRWGLDQGDDRAIRWKEAEATRCCSDVRQRRAPRLRCTRAGSRRMIGQGRLPGRFKVAYDALSPAAIAQPIWHDAIIVEGRPTTSCSRRCTPTGPSSASSHRASATSPHPLGAH